MLRIMRKHKQSIIIKGLFLLLVVLFIAPLALYKLSDKDSDNQSFAVKVNGEKVSYDDFLRNFDRMKAKLQEVTSQPVTPEVEKKIRKYVLDSLINSAVVMQEAKRTGIKVSDEEVDEAIRKMPEFQKDGTFEPNQFAMLLTSNKLTPEIFKRHVREEMMRQKAVKNVMDGVKVSDQDALQAYKKMRDSIDLHYVALSPADVKKDVKVSDQDLQSYLQQHEKDYRTKEEIRIAYLILSPDKVASKVAVSDNDMQNYYQKHIDTYQGPDGILPFEKVKDRVKVDTVKSMAAKLAYEKAAEALNKNQKTGDLNAAAAMLGTQVSETPFFSRNSSPAALAEATELSTRAFALNKGELGGPVETSKGVFLFKVTARNPSIVPPLAKIRGDLEKRVLDEKSVALVRQRAGEVQTKLAKGLYKGQLQDTGEFRFTEKGVIPGIGTSREIMDAAFLLSKAAPAPATPFQIDGRWYAIRLKNRVEADTAPFQQEKEKIKQALLPARQQEVMGSWIKGLRDKAKVEINTSLAQD
jgi:peptidyl-prolyl cis-trans isomerase D